MRIIHYSHYEIEKMGVTPGSIDVARTFTLGNLIGNFPFPQTYYKQSGPTTFFAGRGDWTDAIIEFDETPPEYHKYPELDFPGETYYGVIPFENLRGTTWRCKVDKVEQKVP